jgi:hypothetical protein
MAIDKRSSAVILAEASTLDEIPPRGIYVLLLYLIAACKRADKATLRNILSRSLARNESCLSLPLAA